MNATVVPTSLWVWDAGLYLGISDSDSRARQDAEMSAREGDGKARVERASMALDPQLQPVYARSGAGWAARTGDDGTFTWEPFGGMSGDGVGP